MMRHFVISVISVMTYLLAATSSFADDAKKPVLRWHGHSYFDLTTSKGTRIVFDPHAIEGYGRQGVPADLVLISHSHNDHNQLGRHALLAIAFNGMRIKDDA